MTDAVTLAVIARLDAKQDRLEAAMADGFAVITRRPCARNPVLQGREG